MTAAQDWQPIETAPKDLTQVLVYDAEDKGVFLGQYECYAVPPYWSFDTHDLTREKAEIVRPTHWMPLPDPPTVG